MPTDKELTIRAEYTGNKPNMRPAANAFARAIRSAVNPDGSFTDPDLEAEFQQWLKDKERKERAS